MTLPENFSFLQDTSVAGSAHPGEKSLTGTLVSLDEAGVRAIVSLTERPLPTAQLAEFDMHYLHEPIPDFSAPSMEQIVRALDFIHEAESRGDGVLVHCMGGIGRTGTMLACYLVSKGRSADQAIAEVRRVRPGSIEVADQERAVRDWAEHEKSRHRPEERD